MSLSDKLNLLVSRYTRRQIPSLSKDDLGPYFQEELRAIETTLRSLADASIQVADREPENPRIGMVRYAIGWHPDTTNPVSKLVVYTGTTNGWVAV